MKTDSSFPFLPALTAAFIFLTSNLWGAELADDPQELANRANQAMAGENWEEARVLLDRALELAEDAPELWVGSAFTLIRLEMVEEARERYETALELYQQRVENTPENAGLVMNVGYTLVLLNRRDEAIDYLQTAAERNPNQPMFQNFEAIADGLEANFSEFIVPVEEDAEND